MMLLAQLAAAEGLVLGYMPFMVFDLRYFLFLAPALILSFIAQIWISSAYSRGSQIAVRMTGAEAARMILDRAGLQNVQIEPVGGHLSDHYDPRHKVLRLSQGVYASRNASAVGIAAHEAGHALQDAHRYVPLVVRNLAVPLAGFGSNVGILLLIVGLIFSIQPLLWAGIALFSCVVFFQLVNLPVEFNASNRAKALLYEYGIVGSHELGYVNSVLNAAALTYVAATLQSLLTLLYYVMRANERR
jgi:Zn-dependent membrane protease YugP